MIKSWPRKSWLLLSLLLTACTAGHSDVASSASVPLNAPIAKPAEKSTIAADPALWVIRDEDTTIYFFGTIHLLKPEIQWFDDEVKTAFDSADQLVVEMIQPEPAEMIKIVNELAIDKSGVPLRDKLGATERTAYEAALTEFDLPVVAFDPLEPWYASVSLSVIPIIKSGYQLDQGVDKRLVSEATARKITVTGLETARQQLGFFDDLPEAMQLRFLNFTVATIDDAASGLDAMVTAWSTADVETLAAMMNAGFEDKQLYDTLLVNRNANWAQWVDQRMAQPGTVFVAVGAGHLAGKGSLQSFLEKKGYQPQRVKN